MNLAKLIDDCQSKLDEGTQGEFVAEYNHLRETHRIRTLSTGSSPSVHITDCFTQANARNIAALHNGFRKQLEVVRVHVNGVINSAAILDVDPTRSRTYIAVRAMLTPLADALGVEYDS